MIHFSTKFRKNVLVISYYKQSDLMIMVWLYVNVSSHPDFGKLNNENFPFYTLFICLLLVERVEGLV